MLNMEKQSESPCIHIVNPGTEVCVCFFHAIVICKSPYQYVANNGACQDITSNTN